MRRTLWNTLGFASLGLGMLGAALPLLPATPFLLLSAFAFGQGSPRFRRWIVTHPAFGPAVARWEAHGAIAPRHKRLAVTGVALTFALGVAVGLPGTALAIQAACLAGVLAFVLTRPDGPPER